MTEKIIQYFNQFIKIIDDRTLKFINLKDNKLTENISSIHSGLWRNYKEINGTSAGFHGISEYIVFSTIKNFIEGLNEPQKFRAEPINKDLRYFELKKNNKLLRIYRAASLKHFPMNVKLNRAPDIATLKKENDNIKMVAVVEIKNYLDKGSAESGIEILSQIREAFKDSTARYALFSFGEIAVKDEEVVKKLNKFQENEDCFLITMKREIEEFKVIDLSEFLNIIRNELIL